MQAELRHYIVVETGYPYITNTWIELVKQEVLLGRAWEKQKPDLDFESLYVSRKHALLKIDDDVCWITDLESKHGTLINNVPLQPNNPFELKHGDQISLANGIVTLLYKTENVSDGHTITLTSFFPKGENVLGIDLDKKEVRLEGALLNFSGKERELLFLLYTNQNKAVSYSEIKNRLWPERRRNRDNVADVGNDEVNAIVYRLRRRLGSHGNKIVTVPRFGVLLEI